MEDPAPVAILCGHKHAKILKRAAVKKPVDYVEVAMSQAYLIMDIPGWGGGCGFNSVLRNSLGEIHVAHMTLRPTRSRLTL